MALRGEKLIYADLEYDLAAYRVRRAGRPVDLTPAGYRLLRLLMENPERVFSREDLVQALWTHEAAVEHGAVNALVKRLRTALGAPNVIRTVRSSGYSLDLCAAQSEH